MLRVNFYGGPCVGKSTLAALVYSELNRVGVRAELVQEFIKLWAYEGRQPDAYDQVYTFANQLWAEHRLARAGVKVVVTDSPILLQCVYTSRLDQDIARHLRLIATTFESLHTSLNFFVRRTVAYDPLGRLHDAEAARAIDNRITAYLATLEVPYLVVAPEERDTIIQTVKKAVYSNEI
jgi:hypothetical protein